MTTNLKSHHGVYKIANLLNGKFYIGSTTTPFSVRFRHHELNLRKNKHGNPHLQHSWNKYGAANFQFSVVEICDKTKCFEREQHYIDTLHPAYNILPKAGIVTGYKHTAETKAKISRAFTGKNHPAYSGEYMFYHPVHGMFIGGMMEFNKRFGLRRNIGSKLKTRLLDKSHGWIYIGKSTDTPPEHIDEFYHSRCFNDSPIHHFIHTDGTTFSGRMTEFYHKYKLDTSTISKLIRGKRKYAFGWRIKT
jgi:group I intron endonuclease